MPAFYDPGTYVCEVTEQGFQKASTGRDMIVLRILIKHQIVNIGLPDESLDSVPTRYERDLRLVIVDDNEKSMGYLLKKLRHAGLEGDSFRGLEVLVGSDVRCTCTHGQYQGDSSEQWDLMLPPLKESEPLKSDPATIMHLDALFARQLKAEEKAAKKAKPKAEKQAEAVPPDDEGPF